MDVKPLLTFTSTCSMVYRGIPRVKIQQLVSIKIRQATKLKISHYIATDVVIAIDGFNYSGRGTILHHL